MASFLDLASHPQLHLESFLQYFLRRVVTASSADAAACRLSLPYGSVPSPQIRNAAVHRDPERPTLEILARWKELARSRVEPLALRQPRRLGDLTGEPPQARLLAEGRSVLEVPLLENRRAFGLLRLEASSPNHFGDEVADRVQTLAGEVVAAVYRLLLREQLLAAGVPMELIGTSPVVLALEHHLRRAATSGLAPVLITGERGTGKELAAWAIHCWSARHDRPFVPVLTSGLPDTLASDELFGHERHAFTGAGGSRPGKFEAAAGGTLFLDEVADISPAVQAALLRVIEHKELARLGRDLPVQVDARVMAATNKDLAVEMKERRFREDLFDRLLVFEVNVPPLRERRNDIPLLADHFLRQYCAEMKRRDDLEGRGPCCSCRHPGRIGCASQDFYHALQAYEWPGNVRELKHLMLRLMATVRDEVIDVHHLPGHFWRKGSTEPRTVTNDWSLDTAMRRHIGAVLNLTDGNKSQAARLLGLPYSTFQSKLKKLGIRTGRQTARSRDPSMAR